MRDLLELALVAATLLLIVVFFLGGLRWTHRSKGIDAAKEYEGGSFLISLVAAAAAIDFYSGVGGGEAVALAGVLAVLFIVLFRREPWATIAMAITGLLGIAAAFMKFETVRECGPVSTVPPVLLIAVLIVVMIGGIVARAARRRRPRAMDVLRPVKKHAMPDVLSAPLAVYAVVELVFAVVFMFGVPLYAEFHGLARWVILLGSPMIIGLAVGLRPKIVIAVGGIAILGVNTIGASIWGTTCSPARWDAFAPLLTYVMVYVLLTALVVKLFRR